jgi:hypothetical protein
MDQSLGIGAHDCDIECCQVRPLTTMDSVLPHVRACGIARRTPKRTRDYPSPKLTLNRFFYYKLPFFFFNYYIIIEDSDSDPEISNILSLSVLKGH